VKGHRRENDRREDAGNSYSYSHGPGGSVTQSSRENIDDHCKYCTVDKALLAEHLAHPQRKGLKTTITARSRICHSQRAGSAGSFQTEIASMHLKWSLMMIWRSVACSARTSLSPCAERPGGRARGIRFAVPALRGQRDPALSGVAESRARRTPGGRHSIRYGVSRGTSRNAAAVRP